MTLVDHGNFLTRISWTGIIAGLAVGAATQLALTALGVAFGAGADSVGNLATRAVIWLAVSVIVSSFLAGLTAARAAGYLTPAQGRFNGLVTGSLLALLFTFILSNALTAGFRAATGIVSGATSVASSAASAASNSGVGQTDAAQSLVNGLNEQQIGSLIGQAAPDLSEQQATAATRVVTGIVQRASTDIGSNLSNISGLPDLINNRVKSITNALQGQEFVTRLQRAGLSQQQATATATSISQRVTELQQQAANTAQAAERIARQTATRAAWTFLLALGLILGFTTLGGGLGKDLPQEGAVVTGTGSGNTGPVRSRR